MEFRELLREIDIPNSLFDQDDLKILEDGIPVTESEDDFSESQSFGRGTPDHPARYAIEHLMMDKAQRQNEIRHLRNDYEQRVKELQFKIKDLQKEKEGLEDAMEMQRGKFKHEMRLQKEQMQNEIDQLNAINRKMQYEAPVMQQRLEGIKDQLRNLLISEEYYIELKRVPESDRPLKDWVQVQVFELVEKYRNDYNQNRQELENLRAENYLFKEKLQRAERELSHKEVSTGGHIKDLERKYQEVIIENKKLHNQLETVKRQADLNSDKALRYDELFSDKTSLEHQKAKLEQQIDAQITQIQQLTGDRNEAQVLIDTKRQEVDILARDKQYLTKQNNQLQDKIQRLEDRNDRLEIEIVETKNSAQDYLNKLLDFKTEKTSSFEEKFTQELINLRDRHAREIEELKSSLNDIHERRIDYLKEQKEELEARCLKYEQDLKDKSEAYDQVLIEYRMYQNRTEEQLSSLRSELRLKVEQIERTHNIYEDTVKALRQTHSENEMLKDKVDVLRQEFYKSESKCAKENADLRAKLAVAKEQMQQYAAIEQELDSAIKDNNIQGITAPTSVQRRVKQSLELARQLKQKQDQLDRMREENIALKALSQELEEQLNLNKRLLNSTDQPYAYLVSQVESKEKEISEHKRRFAQLNQKYLDLGENYRVIEKKKVELEEDIRAILTKRQALDSLHETLSYLVEQTGGDQSKLKPKSPMQQNRAPGWFNNLRGKLKKK